MVGLIPARAGSKRIPGKNIKPFFGHPLIAYTIQAAKDSCIFSDIYVSTEACVTGEIAQKYGAKWIIRPPMYAVDLSPDAEWINHAFTKIEPDDFMILRPTSPFRTAETIKRAAGGWKHICLKAVKKITERPEKMWELVSIADIDLMKSYKKGGYKHLLQSNSFDRELFIQAGCLEIRPFSNSNGEAFIYQSFFTVGYEGVDINTPDDWLFAEMLVEKGLVSLGVPNEATI